MVRINSELRKLTLNGGCVNVNAFEENRTVCGAYQKMYVSDGSLKYIKVAKKQKACDGCSYGAPQCTPALDVYVNKSAYTCVILESHMQLANGDWIGTRQVIFGNYKGQKMIDVRKEFNRRDK